MIITSYLILLVLSIGVVEKFIHHSSERQAYLPYLILLVLSIGVAENFIHHLSERQAYLPYDHDVMPHSVGVVHQSSRNIYLTSSWSERQTYLI